MTSTDKNLNQVVMNLLTKAQYDTKNANNEISDDEFYLLTDQDTLLNETQLAAVNSGITSALVNTIQTNQTNINSLFNEKQDIINESNLLPYEYLSNTPSIPTKVSDLTNDSGYLTSHQSLANYALKSEIPTKVSDLTNDSGYLVNSDLTSINTSITNINNSLNTLNGTGDGSISKSIDTKIAAVVANAPSDFDTLKEIADWISTHSDSASAMNSEIQSLKTSKQDTLTTAQINAVNSGITAEKVSQYDSIDLASYLPKTGGILTGNTTLDNSDLELRVTDGDTQHSGILLHSSKLESGSLYSYIKFSKDLTTSLGYYIAADSEGIDISGGNVKIEGNLLPETDNISDLGSSDKMFKDIYANSINFSKVYKMYYENGIRIKGNFIPAINGYSLGRELTPWKNIYVDNISDGANTVSTTDVINAVNNSSGLGTYTPLNALVFSGSNKTTSGQYYYMSNLTTTSYNMGSWTDATDSTYYWYYKIIKLSDYSITDKAKYWFISGNMIPILNSGKYEEDTDTNKNHFLTFRYTSGSNIFTPNAISVLGNNSSKPRAIYAAWEDTLVVLTQSSDTIDSVGVFL